MRTRLIAFLSALALTLALAAPAMAQTDSPTADAYQGVAGEEVAGGGGSGGGGGGGGEVAGETAVAAQETTTAESSGKTLPFTGAELGIFALVGAALLGTGLVVRHTARNHDTA
jgi:hypothetical protein